MDTIITAREAATLLGIAVSTFHWHVRRGDIQPSRKLPGLRGPYLFERSEVEAYGRSRKAGR
jgi:predicted site-specific integrase-resolvase